MNLILNFLIIASFISSAAAQTVRTDIKMIYPSTELGNLLQISQRQLRHITNKTAVIQREEKQFKEIEALLATMGPRDSGGGNENLLIFKTILDDLIVLLKDMPHELVDVYPSSLTAQDLEKKIYIVASDRLQLNGHPVTAINYPSISVIQVDTRRWEDLLSKKNNAIAFVYHELLQVLGDHDHGQNYHYSSKLLRKLDDRPRLRMYFQLFSKERKRGSMIAIDQDLHQDIEHALSRRLHYGPNMPVAAFLINGTVEKAGAIPVQGSYRYKVTSDFYLFSVDDDFLTLGLMPSEQKGCDFIVEQKIHYSNFGVRTHGRIIGDVTCRVTTPLWDYEPNDY